VNERERVKAAIAREPMDCVPLGSCAVDHDIVEKVVDCYQSLQTTAGMEIGLLKAMFGDRVAFWGGVPVEPLVVGTLYEIGCAVRQAMERDAPGSGFILEPSHSIAYGTKYENFMAMLDEYVRLRDRF
jgi:uroporphyrinogen-III decarboxylase